jgi:excisionase family DNA binding protein
MSAIKLFNKNYYSLSDAAKIINVTLTTIRSYVKKGILQARKVGGKWLICEDILREYSTGSSSSEMTSKLIQFDSNFIHASSSYLTKSFSKQGKQHGCCYTSGIPINEMEDILNMLSSIKIGDYSNSTSHLERLNVFIKLLVNALKERYSRIRISVYTPEDRAFYGYISEGMDENFKLKFDSYPEHPLKLKKYKMKLEEIEQNTLTITGLKTITIICFEYIRSLYEGRLIPDCFKDAGYGKKINHSINLTFKNPNSNIYLSVFLDFGVTDRIFYYEEFQILESIFCNSVSQIIIQDLLLSSLEHVDEEYIHKEASDYFSSVAIKLDSLKQKNISKISFIPNKEKLEYFKELLCEIIKISDAKKISDAIIKSFL